MKLQSLEAFNQSLVSDDEIDVIIRNAIESLPGKCRQIFILNKINGKKYREIAEELNISINTVENQMGIALRKMREKLKNHLPILMFFIIP